LPGNGHFIYDAETGAARVTAEIGQDEARPELEPMPALRTTNAQSGGQPRLLTARCWFVFVVWPGAVGFSWLVVPNVIGLEQARFE